MPRTKGILGKKIGMTRLYNEHGRSIPVTVIQAGPCTILQKKTIEVDGYDAIQVGFIEKKASHVNMVQGGHVKRSGGTGFYHIKEFRVDDPDSYEVGQKLVVTDILKKGDKIHISGTTKGRGFQGVVKRHGFRGGRATHGSMFHRAPGSIGCSAWPARVVKGKKLPGHMGNRKVTVKNLSIIDVRDDENLVLIKGAIPGARNGIVQLYTIDK